MKPKANLRFLALATVATLPFAIGNATAANLTWNGPSGGNWNTTETNWLDGGSPAFWNSDTPDSAIFGATGVGAVNVGTGITAEAITFNVVGYTLGGNAIALSGISQLTANADAAIASVLTGTNGLGKDGPGMLTFTGVNTYSGTTDITAGTLRLGNGTVQPTINSTYNIDTGGTLRIQYNTANGAVAQTWSKYTGPGKLVLTTGKNNDAGFGEGALTTNFTGTLRIEAGRVSTPGTGTLGLGGATAVEIAAGGHLGMWNGGTFTQPFTIAGTGYGETGYEAALRFANSATVPTTLTGPVTLAGNTTVGGSGSGVISGPISESTPSSLSLGTTSMGGTMTLSGTNTYTGTTTINFGTGKFAKRVSLYNDTPALWTDTNLVVKSGTTAGFNVGAADEFSQDNIATLAGLGTATGGFMNGSSLGLDTTNAVGPFTLSLNLANPNGGANALGLNKLGAGTLVLTGANTYTGKTTTTAGTLLFANRTALYNGTTTSWNTTNLNFQTGAVAAFRVGGVGEFTAADLDSLKGLGSATGGFRTGALLGLDTTNAPGGVFTYTTAIGNAGTNTRGLVKLGSGTLEFTGANTYTLATTVTEGALTYSGAGSYVPTGTANNLLLGTATGSRAVLNMNSTGTIQYYTTVNVGGAGPSANGAGAINQTSGTVNLMNSGGYMQLGNGGYGSYAMTGGTLTFNGTAGIRVGDNTDGLGVFNQTGGTVNLNRIFVVGGNSGTGPIGVATLTGGILNGSASYHILLGNAGTATGILNIGTQAGGNAALVSKNASGIRIGDATNPGTPMGILNLNSGTIQFDGTSGAINRVNSNNGATTGFVNLNGGTLKANAADRLLIDNTPTSVNVFNGGVTVDTQTNNATISANLLATSGNGIYPAGGIISVPANGGAGYIGAPVVTVATSGAGTGATAVANVTNGVVTGVTLTCPGQGYQAGDTVSFTFLGGGSTTPAATYDHTLTPADLAANGSGGLIKTGTGTLTLTGASTYGGTTSVNAGVLSLSPTWSAPNTPLLVRNAATLQLVPTGKTLHSVGIESGAALALPIGMPATALTNALTFIATPNFSVKPLFSSPPQVGTYDLLVPGSIVGTPGTITTDFSAFGVSRVTGTTTVSGGKLVLNITNPGGSLTWNNAAANGVWDLNTSANFSGAVPGTFLNLDSVTFGDTAAGTVTLTGTLAPAVVTVDSSLAYTFGGTGLLAGTGSLTKAGTGTLTISGSHSFTGAINANGGVIAAATLAANGVNSSIGSGSALNFNGGILRYTGTAQVGNDAGGKFDRAIDVGANGGALDIAGSNIVFSSSTLTGSGKLSIIDSSGDVNNRQLLYSGNSPAFTGTIEIGTGAANSGWLQLRSNAPIPFGTGPLVINGGGIFSADNGTTAPTGLGNPIVLNGGSLLTQIPNLTFTGPITANTGTVSTVGTYTTSAGEITLNGNLTGGGTVSSTSGASKSVKLGGDNSGFTGIWQATSAQTWFNTATSGSAAAKWVANGTNLIGAIPGGGTIQLGELSGTVGAVKNDITGSTCEFSIGALGTNSTFAGSITDKTGDPTSKTALTKVGSGTLAITGSVAYTGPTVVTAGTLQLPATTATTPTLTESCTVANGATLAIGGVAGGIWETKSLTLGSGGGTTLSLLGLTGSATRGRVGATETLTINGPVTLKVAGNLAAGQTIPLIEYPEGGPSPLSSLTLSPPRGVTATLVNNASNSSIDMDVSAALDLVWRGNNGGAWDINTTTNWVLGSTPEKFLDGDRVVFDDTATGTTTVVLDATVAPVSVAFSNTTKDYTVTGSGGISGTLGLSKTNPGTLTLATTNTYTGATTVDGGILQLGDGIANGVIAGPLVNNAEVVFNPATTQTYAGVISGGGTTLTKYGPATLILTSTTNTFGGEVKVDGGTLQIGSGANNGSFGSSTYTVADGARLYLNYATAVPSTSAAPWTANVKGAGTLEINSAQAVNGTANWGANTGSPAVNPFSAEFTGTFIMGKGRFDSPGSGMGGVSKLVVKSGAQFMSWSGTFPMAIELAGLGWGEPGGTFGYPGALRTAAGGVATFSGPITLAANSGILAQTDAVVTLTGSITGAYQLDLAVGSQFGNKGTLTVAPESPDQNSYGSTRILGSGTDEAGAVVAGNARAFSTGGLKVDSCILKLNGFSFTFANLSGLGGKIGNYAADPAQLTVGTDNSNTSCASLLADGGVGTLALAKTGTGTLILTGNSTFTGGTTISGGVLQIGNGTTNGTLPGSVINNANLTFANATAVTFGGAISGTGSLTKNSAGTLTLTGANSYGGATTVNAGILSLGSASLSDTAAVTVTAGAKLDLTTGTTDTVGSLVLGGVQVPAGTYGASHPTYGSYFTATSTGSLVVVGGYASWAADPANGLTAGVNDGTGQDPDLDGVSNLLEYALGGKPMQANPAILPQPSISGGFLVLSYKRSDASEADTTQTGRWSGNLLDWTGTAITPELINENGTDPDDMVIRIPLTNAVAGKLFGRLSVTK